MSWTDSRLEYLFDRYFQRTASPEEEKEFFALIREARQDSRLKELMDQAWQKVSPSFTVDERQSASILASILKRKPRGVARRYRMLQAAAVLLCLLTGSWLLFSNRSGEHARPATPVTAAPVKDVAPGGNKAVLILANGAAVLLDSLHNGLVARQGNVHITKLNGALRYKQEKDGHVGVVLYNTVITPRGGQYALVLPDGSRVWLNAASSLRFPTAFTGKERTVELKGEAYFEVAPNSTMPFRVMVKGMDVKVLGTHFDIMAYADEPAIRTTLLEGSVEVLIGEERALLRPGQQARVSSEGGGIRVAAADVTEAIAWKNGLFLFHHTDIREVLRQLSRWYDIDIGYEGEVSANLNGMIARNTRLSSVLRMLELTSKIRFTIKGNRIVAAPAN
jgi:ferric-dicitrate binding protein FerR (iron transport regulator)